MSENDNENNHGNVKVETKLLAKTVDIDRSHDDNFIQGCQFAPDGSCILTCTARDATMRLYNTIWAQENVVDWKSALKIKNVGDSIRCYDWYPFMKSDDPSTCAFVVASRGRPVQLFDAYNGSLRASYRPYNALDEMESPNVVTFDTSGNQIYCGGFRSDRMIYAFDVTRPGRDQACLYKLGKTRHSQDGQKGLVSALAFVPSMPNVFVVGTYSPGSIYIYDKRCSESVTVLHDGVCLVGHGKRQKNHKRRFTSSSPDIDMEDDWLSNAKKEWYKRREVHQSGITQLTSPSSSFLLYSACRRSNSIQEWDLRQMSSTVTSYPQYNPTNQRLEFHLSEDTIYITNANRTVTMYHTNLSSSTETIKPFHTIKGFMDTTNGVSSYSSYLAIGVGSRRFHQQTDSSSDDISVEEEKPPGSLELYSLQSNQPTIN